MLKRRKKKRDDVDVDVNKQGGKKERKKQSLGTCRRISYQGRATVEVGCVTG